MKDMRLTSPGVMLIIAVVLAGGIFLLDTFYLQPNVEHQRKEALQSQAISAQQAVNLAISAEQGRLVQFSSEWTSPERASLWSAPQDQAKRDSIRKMLSESGVSDVWLSDSAGTGVATWSAVGHEPFATAELSRSVKPLLAQPGAARQGVIALPQGPAFFSQRQIPSSSGTGALNLWVARDLDAALTARFAGQTGCDIHLVPNQPLPSDNLHSGLPDMAMWEINGTQGGLAVAWTVKDPSGNAIGYFLARTSAAQITNQAQTARRMILIVLSLSMGLVVLIIMGMHMLVTGPVVRLLQRLQQVESGQEGPKQLSRDLHGEPLVLARRLESAFEKLAHLSKTDQLTGLANRRHFEEVLNCFYHQSRRYNRPLSLAIIDIDFFKALNDTGGHQVGDDVLKQVSQDINACCRKADLPARWGGDEFAILLPETSCDDAALVVQRLCDAVRKRTIEAAKSTIKLTLSVGVTDLNSGEIDSPDAMVNLADRALYSAKEMGRNRIVLAHDLNGLTWPNSSENNVKVDVLCKKLAGLDSKIKELFLRAVEEVVVILEQRDPHMVDHARKVQHYSVLVAQEMGLPQRVIKRLEIAAMLHDIGMIAMPDSILTSPTPLNEQQVQVMRRHPLLSVRIMEGMEFLEQEIPAVRYHHERFDGKGYPEGLAASQIPLTARILAVADSFVAMTSPRSFRGAKDMKQAMDELSRESGRQFDPAIVETFRSAALRMGDLFTKIEERKEPSFLDLPEIEQV